METSEIREFKRKRELLDVLNNKNVKDGDTFRQHVIRTAVAYFEEMYPGDLKDNSESCHKAKELAKDEFSSTADLNDMRNLFIVPRGLITLINELIHYYANEEEEPIFGKAEKEGEWFWKEFPRFRVAAKL